MRPNPERYIARWDATVVVNVYVDGDYKMVVEEDGRFQAMSEGQLHCFFRRMPDSEVEPDGRGSCTDDR